MTTGEHKLAPKEEVTMKKKVTCAAFLLVSAAHLLTGCGGGSSTPSGTGTVQDATAVGTSVIAADAAGLIAILTSPIVAAVTKQTPAVDKAVVVDVSIVETTLACTEGTFSEATGTVGTATLNGTDIGTDGSGSCAVKTDGTLSAAGGTLEETLNCSSFNGGSEVGNVTMSGLLGFFPVLTFGPTSVDVTMFNLSTIGLTGTVNGKNCDMIVGVDGNATVSRDGTGRITIDGGCIAVCNTNFTITGTIDF
jgi:hypothetical protein